MNRTGQAYAAPVRKQSKRNRGAISAPVSLYLLPERNYLSALFALFCISLTMP